jgi:hypothetical protein
MTAVYLYEWERTHCPGWGATGHIRDCVLYLLVLADDIDSLTGRMGRTPGSADMTARWHCVKADEHIVHVLPIADLTEHQLDDDCPCGPSSEFLKAGDGCDAWLHIHHALDGREANETGGVE